MVIPGRMIAMGLAALLLGGASVAVAATRTTDSAVESVAPAGDDRSPTTTTTTTEPATTTTVSATSTTASTASTTTSTAGRATTTVVRVTTTRRPAPTTTVRSSIAACVPAQIAVAISTDRPSYAPGQEVKVISTLRNTSSVTCSYNGYSVSIEFKDETGKSFGGPALIADSFADVPFAPGQVLTNSASWDHRRCPEPTCGPLPPGVYTAAAKWGFGATYDVSTSLILT